MALVNSYVSALNNKLASGRVEIVVNEDNTLGYRLDGADPVHFFNYNYLIRDGKIADNPILISASLSNLAYSNTYGGLVLQKTTGSDYYGNADGNATLQINVTNIKKIYVNAISRSTYFHTTLDGVRHCGNIIDVSTLTGIHTFVIRCGNQSNVGVSGGVSTAPHGPDNWNSIGIYDVYYK